MFHLLLGQRALAFGRGAEHKASRRDDGALGDQRPGSDDAVFPDDRPVEQDGAHADGAVVPYSAGVQDGAVADGDPFSDGAGLFGVGVQDAAVLDVAVCPDANGCVVGPQHGVVPHACPVTQGDIPDDAGTRCGVCGPLYGGEMAVCWIKHDILPFTRGFFKGL